MSAMELPHGKRRILIDDDAKMGDSIKSKNGGQVAGLILGIAAFAVIALDLPGFGPARDAPGGHPANTVIFSSGKVRMGEMVRTGLVLNLLIAFIVATFLYFVLLPAWDMAPALPGWAH